jgi:hypothetical protein
MPSGFPVTITDDDGDAIEVDLGMTDPTEVYIRTSRDGVLFNAAQREELAQALVAACHEADRQASPKLCGEPNPAPVRERAWTCSLTPGHAPLDHAAHDGQGQVCVRWAVSDG